MKLLSYNINGIRAAMRKGLVDFLREEDADVVCFQELKAMPEQFDTGEFEELGYKHYWYPAQKKGYSGVGILTKLEPNSVEYGSGYELGDSEGRIIRADYDKFSVMSVYFPSGTSGDERQQLKYEFLDYIYDYVKELRAKHPNLILSGDYNICNHAIDIHDPVGNKKSSGFLPEEREWLSKFFDSGMNDSFRKLYPERVKYSWWSFRANARANNKGWRIDYNAVSDGLLPHLKEADMLNDAKHSDHCPVLLELDI